MTLPNIYFVVFGVLFLLVLAFAISLFYGYMITKRVISDNSRLRDIYEEQREQTIAQQEALNVLRDEKKNSEKALEELKESILNNSQIQMLQQKTGGLKKHITDTAKMNDEELMAWVDQQMDEMEMFRKSDLTLKEMSSSLGLTQRRLSQILKSNKEYGRFADYLTAKRLVLVCKLLHEQPDWTIDAICKEAGFSSRRNFQDLFKNKLGVTPSQYRWQHGIGGQTDEVSQS